MGPFPAAPTPPLWGRGGGAPPAPPPPPPAPRGGRRAPGPGGPPGPPPRGAPGRHHVPAPGRRDVPLVVTAVAYCLCHHLGSLPQGLGQAGRGTRVTDWLDLLVPFVVLLPALGTLLSAGVGRATSLWFAVG